MQRTGCFGSCPIYSITIEGSGEVTYVGEKDVALVGSHTETLPPDKIRKLAKSLDDIGFFGLEDRSFEACADSPRVAISVKSQGNEKTIVSDQTCIGAKSGEQAEFVSLANQIDKLVGSDRWVSSRQ